VTIIVRGEPAPQGSKRFLGIKGGRGIMVESSGKVRPWREAVKYAALAAIEEAGHVPWSSPLNVEMHFTLPRPKSAPRWRVFPDRRPDLSKLIRSTEDALTDAGVWHDDAQVVGCQAYKFYVGYQLPEVLPVPGCVIKVHVL